MTGLNYQRRFRGGDGKGKVPGEAPKVFRNLVPRVIIFPLRLPADFIF